MAKLINYDTKGVYIEFPFAPEQITTESPVNYGVYDTASTVGKPLSWGNTPGSTYRLERLIISSFRRRVSVQPQLDLLLKLREPTTLTGKPPVVQLQLGSKTYPPCHVTGVTVETTAWLPDTGEPTDTRVSLTLLEIPIPKAAATANSNANTNKLTEREQQSAVSKANQLGLGITQDNINPYTWAITALGELIGVAVPDTPYIITKDQLTQPTLPSYLKTRIANLTQPAARDNT